MSTHVESIEQFVELTRELVIYIYICINIDIRIYASKSDQIAKRASSSKIENLKLVKRMRKLIQEMAKYIGKVCVRRKVLKESKRKEETRKESTFFFNY